MAIHCRAAKNSLRGTPPSLGYTYIITYVPCVHLICMCPHVNFSPAPLHVTSRPFQTRKELSYLIKDFSNGRGWG